MRNLKQRYTGCNRHVQAIYTNRQRYAYRRIARLYDSWPQSSCLITGNQHYAFGPRNFEDIFLAATIEPVHPVPLITNAAQGLCDIHTINYWHMKDSSRA